MGGAATPMPELVTRNESRSWWTRAIPGAGRAGEQFQCLARDSAQGVAGGETAGGQHRQRPAWEQVEPNEGKFDFISTLIAQTAAQDLKLACSGSRPEEQRA
jgi:hypothetical protein